MTYLNKYTNALCQDYVYLKHLASKLFVIHSYLMAVCLSYGTMNMTLTYPSKIKGISINELKTGAIIKDRSQVI